MFHYKTLDEFQSTLKDLNITLPFASSTDILKTPVHVDSLTVPNRLVIQPMEGCDGTEDGRLGEQTWLRYERFAKSGAGLIWFEAVAVCKEGRANPRQLYITDQNVEDFKKAVSFIKQTCYKENGYEPIVIMQATHSGRYSKPNGTPRPLVLYHNEILEKTPLDDSCIISDDYIKTVEENMTHAVSLAKQAGFDGVDIKSCHRYLSCEFLSAFKREGLYGGSFENRTRFIRNCVSNANTYKTPSFVITSRMNIYDGYPYPNGFGVAKDGSTTPDYTESKALIKILHEDLHMNMMDITMGNPYNNPHINRPADIQPYEVSEDPLHGVERILNGAREIQTAFPSLNVIGSGLTYLRQYTDVVCAGAVEQNYFKMAGLGRMAFAYPEVYQTILKGDKIDPKKVCITCGKCSLLMRYGSTAGCVIRNKYYTDLFRKVSEGKTPTV